ncbi:MAG: GNAT family N-acetyltransferase [Laribacter sp.]|nr:GNAT family N-acetyltransferase [Laribacter sp.]MBP9527245.1 GNAT family N-acetyltransferase [Laribacter sp.]MBP9609336.1 GNAT family N-acetyltransferase [Laribacter sp.]
MTFRLLPLTESCLPACLALACASVAGLTGRQYDARQRAAWVTALQQSAPDWPVRLSAGSGWLALDSAGQPAGFAWRVAREVDMLYVAPAAARRGIGRALLARLTDDMAGQLGPWHAAVSDMALPLFEQAGWQCCEREVVVRDGVEIPRSWMKHVSGAAGDQSVTGE